MFLRLLLWGVAGLVNLLILGVLFGSYYLLSSCQPTAPVTVVIEPGSSLSSAARQLQQAQVIRHPLALKLLARMEENGNRIQAGNYRFSAAATPAEVLQRLVQGDVEKVSLTLPEGFSVAQIFARIADAGYAELESLQQLARDPAFLASLQLPASGLEGYLFPETYLFAPGIDAAQLLRMMVDETRRQLTPELLQQAKAQGLDAEQLVILASIIEKETGAVDEMPLISSVFHNRLKRGIPLQTDPTVIYGIQDFDGNLTRKHLKTPTPYNTYLKRGLPPGPIASPGRKALQAAANPQQTAYLYFVARGDGSHQFSKTLAQHNAAVRRYQLRR